ncbi:unnamed protein product [Lactuca virosa]|uniref:Uncharacterized protein n=1 Tax=Lactuca virosa TaxID=75947 RepID=A0AAU9PMG9_9ASTR|nr:unnamed protein product [Lactuca virosa]
MPPRRSARRNPPITQIHPPLPPPQYNPAAIQAAVAAAVTTTLAQFNTTGTRGSGTAVHSTQVDPPVHSRECSYKDFTNCKPRAFNDSGGIISLS